MRGHDRFGQKADAGRGPDLLLVDARRASRKPVSIIPPSRADHAPAPAGHRWTVAAMDCCGPSAETITSGGLRHPIIPTGAAYSAMYGEVIAPKVQPYSQDS